MVAYDAFAQVYDRFTGDVEYARQLAFIRATAAQYGKRQVQIVLDAGCGTGSLTSMLAGCFAQVIGADASASMLGVAAQKAQKASRDILFLHQSLQQLDLYGTVDLAVCTLDTLNHLPGPGALHDAIERIGLFLAPGGLFIFDVNTLYKHKRILGNETFVYEQDGVFCTWRNAYLEKERASDIMLDFFVPQQGGGYTRLHETFTERYYSGRLLAKFLRKAGLRLLGRFDDYTARPVGETTQRAVYVARRESADTAQAHF